jgi:DnaJ-class molecular chaperone
MDEQNLADWVSRLDALTYYELFDVDASCDLETIQRAFVAFAASFHPDQHRGRVPHEREMVLAIFKRGTEAHRVLTDPVLRGEYDDFVRRGATRLPEASRPRLGSGGSIPPPAPTRLADKTRMPSAKPFVERAEQFFERGDAKQAKLQLAIAMNIDRGNPALEGFMAEIEKRMRAW